MGMGFPLSTPAREAGLVVAILVVSTSWSQSGGRRARVKNEWPMAARPGRAPGFHTAELTLGQGRLAAETCGRFLSVPAGIRPGHP